MQKMVMFTIFFRFPLFFSTTTTTTPQNIFFAEGGTQLPPTCSHLGAGAKGLNRFFPELGAIGNFRYIGNTWRIGPTISKWISG